MGIQSGNSIGEPVLILHGGAGPADPGKDKLEKANNALSKIAKRAYDLLLTGTPPIDVVVYSLCEMENDPQFNAGRGGSLQRDGVVRVSASLMDGRQQTFSGVMNLQNIKNPSKLARALQTSESRVLTNPGAAVLANDLDLPEENLVTEERKMRWQKRVDELGSSDTVGCVLLSPDGHLFSGSSTGGRGFETPGRISDTATVAGNYATQFAAIAVTGIGEQIVDDAVAARMEARVRDGTPLEHASEKCFKEASDLERKYGWISIAKDGSWSIGHTTPAMPHCILTG